MATLAPLALLVPLLTAAVLVGLGTWLPTWLADAVALLAALATTALCAILLARVWHGTEVTWIGGWHPRSGGVAVGIDLAVDPLGAGAATFAGLLLSMAFIYSQRYFDEVTPSYHALMLVLLCGIVGVCLTGDLFDLFVFFTLMSVPGYALTAYDVEESGPIQGGLAFALTSSIGTFLMLSGIGLLYGRTGALNLAQVGEALAHHRADGLVIAAFCFVLCGFLVKAAIVPFHFWLPDAYAVAPVPVCVLFAGIMVEMGLFGLARVYWTVFSGVPGLGGAGVAGVLVAFGAITAVVGALMAIGQDHVKRMFAFSTVCHAGLLLMGLAVFGEHALGAVALFGLAHGAIDAALFMTAGIARREGHGRGVIFLIGGLALASLPPFGPFMGKALLEEAAVARGWWWVPAWIALCTALVGGAIMRFGVRAFRDPEGRRSTTPKRMLAPTLVLLTIGLAAGVPTAMRHGLDHAAAVFADRPAYARQVLHHGPAPRPEARPATGPHTSSYIYAAASVAGALVLTTGALALPRRRPAPLRALHAWHDGHIGDYATWAAVGAAVLGWALAAAVT